MKKRENFLMKLKRCQKNNHEGVTLISVLIMVIVIFIIASIVVTGGISIINKSKENIKEEEKSTVKAAVNRVSVKNETAGILTPATTETYGKPVDDTIYSGEGYDLGDWYLLEKEDLEQMGVNYVEGPYVVNYVENQVYAMDEFKEYVEENGVAKISSDDTRPKYTVQFHKDDDSLVTGNMKSQIFIIGKEQSLRNNTYAREGYHFAGWNTERDGSGTTYTNRQRVKDLTTQDGGIVHLYTTWEMNTYKIRYIANGGTGTMPEQEIRANEEVTLSSNRFERNGFTFIGWNTIANGTGTTYTDGQTVNNIAQQNNYTVNLYAQWKGSSFTIHYDANSGTGSMPDQEMEVGSAKTLLPNAFTKTGYDFVEWNTKPDGTGRAYANEVLAGNLVTSGTITLYAQWTEHIFTIRYDRNTGIGSMEDQQSPYFTTNTLRPNAYTKTGYTFVKWNTSADGSGTDFANEAPVNGEVLYDGITMYAQWRANEFTIKFDANTGTGTMQDEVFTYDIPKNLTANTFTKTGYTFTGWNTEADGSGTPHTDGERINNLLTEGSITFYAQWKANDYTIKFNANTGTGTMADMAMKYDVEKTLTANAFSKTGYSFAGWATSESGAVVYSDEQSVKNLATSGTYNLYAKWTANTYTVSFSANGGSGGQSANVTATYDSAMPTISTTKPSKTGYTFGGWYDTNAATGGTQYYTAAGASARSWNKTSNTTLYARWTANTYTIAYNKGTATGGTLPSSQTATYDKAITLGTNSMTKSNTNLGTVTFNYNGSGASNTTSAAYTSYTANGWSTSSGGSRSYTNGQSVSNLTTSGTYNLYPSFTTKANSATFPSPSRTGYQFAGWYTAASGGTKVTSYTGTSNVTYYAHWTANTYTIAFNGNGSTGGSMSNKSMTYGTAANLPSNGFSRTGYTFAGWATSSGGSVAYSNGQSVNNLTSTNGGTVTLYAKWNVNAITNASFTGSLTLLRGNTGSTSLSYGGTAKTVTYASNDTSKATVSSSGVITASASNTGSCTVTVTITDYAGTQTKKTCSVTVNMGVGRTNNKDYSTLQGAINAVSSGTVYLLQNTTESTNVGSSKNITLDLGGKTLTITSTYNCLYVTGKLTITGNGTVKSGKNQAVWAEGSSASITINNGTYTGNVDAIGVSDGASMTIKGGTFTGEKSGALIQNYSKSTVNVSGGTFTGKQHNGLSNLGTDNTVTITGGTFNGGTDTNLAGINNERAGTITIKNATVNKGKGYSLRNYGSGYIYYQKSTVTLNGSTYGSHIVKQ